MILPILTLLTMTPFGLKHHSQYGPVVLVSEALSSLHLLPFWPLLLAPQTSSTRSFLLSYLTHPILPVLMLSLSGVRDTLNHHHPPLPVAGKRLGITHGCMLPMRTYQIQPLTLILDLGFWLLPKRNLELGYMHSQCQHWDFEWMMKLSK